MIKSDATPPARAGYSEPGALQRLIPPEFAFLLLNKPLLLGESEAEYDALLTATALDRNPETFFEWLAVRDLTDCVWKERRYKTAETSLLRREIAAVAEEVLGDCEEGHFSQKQLTRGLEDVTRGMLRGDARDTAAVQRTLATAGLDSNTLTAAAISRNAETLATLERLSETQRRRFRSIMSDLALHREARRGPRGGAGRGSASSASPLVLDG